MERKEFWHLVVVHALGNKGAGGKVFTFWKTEHCEAFPSRGGHSLSSREYSPRIKSLFSLSCNISEVYKWWNWLSPYPPHSSIKRVNFKRRNDDSLTPNKSVNYKILILLRLQFSNRTFGTFHFLDLRNSLQTNRSHNNCPACSYR